MSEANERPADTAVWQAALDGDPVDWTAFLKGWSATVDWPGCTFWRGLAAAFPDALVLLSTRSSGERWWQSFDATIAPRLQTPVPAGNPEWSARRVMVRGVVERDLGPGWWERSLRDRRLRATQCVGARRSGTRAVDRVVSR